MMKAKHLIAGEWLSGEGTFLSSPVNSPPRSFSNGSVRLVDQAAQSAEDAFWSFGSTTRVERAAFLSRIADEIDARGAELTDIGTEETGLPAGRLEGERGRTIGQLRMFADHIVKDDFLDLRHDEALPDRRPLARPELRSMMRPIGPVAVFGASNFPLAFSTAGGDTASALAAGCPVVVKGHPAHPGTGDVVAQAVDAAIKSSGMHPGVFSFIQDSGYEIAQDLVKHPLIKAVGFTGSHAGGRALFDICAARDEPIPFFGEMGSINPVFVLPDAQGCRGEEIASSWVTSLAMGAGQFCTNPGVIVIGAGKGGDEFIDAVIRSVEAVERQVMLTDDIADAYRKGVAELQESAQITQIAGQTSSERFALPFVFETNAHGWLANPQLAEEVFGPSGIIIRAANSEEMLAVAAGLGGQLTATMQMDSGDFDLATKLLAILERKAGRIISNGFPTGVEVADAMIHGGPYPASTNFGATSVGSLAIRRFLRAVCYQDIPVELLPADVRYPDIY